jgi:hypothetical protein
MKLWIIYKEGILISKIIAEMLQDILEDYIDVSVGNAKKIDPSFLLEEKLDYLIIGDILSETIPSVEIQNWLLKYWKISKKKEINLKGVSGFYIILSDISVEPFWVEYLNDNVKTEVIFSPILRLKLKSAELAVENGALEIVKDYSNDFIEFLLNNKKNDK